MFRVSRRSLVAGVVAASVLPSTTFGQDDPGSPIGLLSQIPGLVSAYGRRYHPAEHGSTEETPDYLLVMALTFEDESMLQLVVNNMLTPEIVALLTETAPEDLSSTEVTDLSEGSVLYSGTNGSDDYISLLVMPIAEVAYLVITRGATDAVQVTSDDIATFIFEQDPVDSEVSVLEEGTAEGGPFDVFPGADEADVLHGLDIVNDYDLLVGESPILPADASPAASPAT